MIKTRCCVVPGIAQIYLLLTIFALSSIVSGVGYAIYQSKKAPPQDQDVDIVETASSLILEESPSPVALGTDTNQDVNTTTIHNPSPAPSTNAIIPTYSAVPLGSTSEYSSSEQAMLNDAYSEFLLIPNLMYMDQDTQYSLLDQIVKKYYAKYTQDLKQVAQETQDRITLLKQTPTPTIPTPTPIYVNPEIEDKLAELRQTLQNIRSKPVATNVITGRLRSAYQSWVNNNSSIYSLIISSRYSGDLEAIRVIYGI